jgi:glucan phosphoethanolaminetransferase (alkaline phosphatase superfamily)
VMLMDESLRADYIDFSVGNPYTPHLSRLANEFVNFGPAVSGGNCSNYSNALLRFGASRKDIIGSANSNATLFAYARKAGYRTVFVDAQASQITNGSQIQNFMTLREKAEIDSFYAIDAVHPAQGDFELSKIIAKELKSNQPVFIYANKNGTHFPYDQAYPPEEAKFRPTMSEADADTQEFRINSYRNAVMWSVDKFWQNLFATTDLSSATIVYTSDHGQRFVPGELTHCASMTNEARYGIVPLLVYTHDPILRQRFHEGAAQSRGKASHFMIAPTLYRLMGYRAEDVSKAYDESLFEGTKREPFFTTGDVFGMFSDEVAKTPVDLDQSQLEQGAF